MRWIRSARSGKRSLQKFFGVIGLGNDYARCIDKFVQTDLEISRRKNVIGMRGKAESDWEELADPEGSARGHSSEVRVNMSESPFRCKRSPI